MPDRRTIHRWRTLEDQGKFTGTLAAAKEKERLLCEGDRNPPVALTGEIEWYTPSEYLELVRAVLGFCGPDPLVAAITVR